MSLFQFKDLVEATGSEPLQGDPGRGMAGVSTDTRTLRAGELYVALDGPNFDGNRFAAAAAKQGAGGLLLKAGAEGTSAGQLGVLAGELPVAVCRDTRRALGCLAAWHRERLAIPVIGITGSCGKTTTKNMLVELLSTQLETVGSPASFNNDVGVPHTLLLARPSTEALVVEVGTNARGEIEALCALARPTAGVITNVGASHLEGLGSVEGVAREKSALVAAVPADGFVVLNGDCRWTPFLKERTRARVITFGVEAGADLCASDVWFHSGGTTFTLNGEQEVTMPLLGVHAVQNLLAAMAVCEGLGLQRERLLPAVQHLRDGKRRMERIQLGDVTLFDDSYNANPASARASVRVLAGLHGHGRRVLVLGEMLELGAHAAREHRQLGRAVAEAGVDLLLLVGEGTMETAAGALECGLEGSAVRHFETTDEAGAATSDLLRPGDVVLVKGSRASGLEHVVESVRCGWSGRHSGEGEA